MGVLIVFSVSLYLSVSAQCRYDLLPPSIISHHQQSSLIPPTEILHHHPPHQEKRPGLPHRLDHQVLQLLQLTHCKSKSTNFHFSLFLNIKSTLISKYLQLFVRKCKAMQGKRGKETSNEK